MEEIDLVKKILTERIERLKKLDIKCMDDLMIATSTEFIESLSVYFAMSSLSKEAMIGTLGIILGELGAGVIEGCDVVRNALFSVQKRSEMN